MDCDRKGIERCPNGRPAKTHYVNTQDWTKGIVKYSACSWWKVNFPDFYGPPFLLNNYRLCNLIENTVIRLAITERK